MMRDRFSAAGSRPHGPGRPAGRLRLASRCAAGRRPDRLAGRRPAARMRMYVCVCVRLWAAVCGGWISHVCVEGDPPFLSIFCSKCLAKFRFLGTANRARKVAFA